MDDDVNRSSESLPTSEEFELIGGGVEHQPRLHIAGDASEEQLKESMQEVLQDIEGNMLDVSPTAGRQEAAHLSVNESFQKPAKWDHNSFYRRFLTFCRAQIDLAGTVLILLPFYR